MVLGDFTLRKDDTMLEDRKPISVDKDNFDKVMQSQGLSLQLQVPNKLSDDPDATLSADLKFEDAEGFRPRRSCSDGAGAGEADAAARGAQGAEGPLSNVPNFRKKLQDLVNDEKTRRRPASGAGHRRREDK